MSGHRAAELEELRRAYAAQVAAFEVLLERIREQPLADEPLNLESEGMWPHGG